MKTPAWIPIPLMILLSCAPPGRANPANRETIAKIRADLESYAFVGSVDDRPREFNPEVILPRIHSWLAPGFGLRRTSIGGTRAFLLAKIPSEVLRDLETSLYPDSTPVPLMILRSSFWTRVAKLQDEGLEVGF
jgi:hypothetical protein